jgi:hypothetical protein
VEFFDEHSHQVHYIRNPFDDSGVTRDFNGTSVNFEFKNLLQKSTTPAR